MTNTIADCRGMDECCNNIDLIESQWAEIKLLREALKVAQQAILEFSHAQESGPSWYTRGANGMYQQVRLWLDRGMTAVSGALGPYDDNGEYEKEKRT